MSVNKTFVLCAAFWKTGKEKAELILLSNPVIFVEWMIGWYVYTFSFPFIFRKAAENLGKMP